MQTTNWSLELISRDRNFVYISIVCCARICAAFLRKLCQMKLAFQRIINMQSVFWIHVFNKSCRKTKSVLYLNTLYMKCYGRKVMELISNCLFSCSIHQKKNYMFYSLEQRIFIKNWMLYLNVRDWCSILICKIEHPCHYTNEIFHFYMQNGTKTFLQ